MKRMLVPTDFTAISRHGLRYALSIAQILKYELIILHADQPDPKDLSGLMEEVNTVTEGSRNFNITYLTSEKQFGSLTVNEQVKKFKIDLIVMGTTGKNLSVEKQLFGANTLDIAEHAQCPVICVPTDYTFSPVKKIAYASDLNFINRQIGPVIELAKAFHAELYIFHVAPVFPDLGNTERMNVSDKIEHLKLKYRYTNIFYEVEQTKNDNEILKGISSFLSRSDMDMMVMFHQHISDIEALFAKSNVEKVLTHIEIPLVVYPG